MRYIAIRVKEFPHWLWFEKGKTKVENGIFIGIGGWGERGAWTKIEVNDSEIIGRIESDTLQYE